MTKLDISQTSSQMIIHALFLDCHFCVEQKSNTPSALTNDDPAHKTAFSGDNRHNSAIATRHHNGSDVVEDKRMAEGDLVANKDGYTATQAACWGTEAVKR